MPELTGLHATLKRLHDRVHSQASAVRDMAPANGNYHDQEECEKELAEIASDLRRIYDPDYARRLDAQKPARKSTGMGDRCSAVLDGRSTGGGEK